MHSRSAGGGVVAAIRWLREGLAWRLISARRQWFLLRSFRNGLALARHHRRREPSDRAICWDGTVLAHPSGRMGLTETLVEIWYDQVYTKGFPRSGPGDVVIDAGANVGLFSAWIARRYPDARVLAFEPFPENFELLSRNVASAGRRVVCYQAGLSGLGGRGRIRDGGARSLDHRLERLPGGSPAEGGVQLYSFSDVLALAGSGEIALFKIDIEGSEHDLLDAAPDPEVARVRRFAIEYHDNIRPGTSARLAERLERTHRVVTRPAGPGYGMIYAVARQVQ